MTEHSCWKGLVGRLRAYLGDGPSIFPTNEGRPPFVTGNQANERVVHFAWWFIGMRWVAAFVAFLLVLLTTRIFHFLEASAFWWLSGLVGLLALTNLVYIQFLRKQRWLRFILDLQIIVDLLILTAMLHCSGGIENPLAFAYLFHIIIAGILLDQRHCYAIVGLASGLFALLALAEMAELIVHRTLLVFPHIGEHGEWHHAAHQPLYVASRLGLQFLLLTLTAYFTTTIMKRLRAEEQRALSDRQRLERVLQATGTGLLILNEDRQLVWSNEQVQEWFPPSILVPGQQVNHFENWLRGDGKGTPRMQSDGATQVVEHALTDEFGHQRFVEVTVAPLIDAQGKTYQTVGLMQDITQRKLLEAEIMHSGKMAVLGLMAAGIAHEVGNPLASIATRLRLLEEQHDEAFLMQSLHLLQREIGRVSRIVHGVSQLARPGKRDWSVCSIHTILHEMLNILQLHKQAKRCQIDLHFADALPETTGVAGQLMQVFLNLGLNALEAMPTGGTLTLRTSMSGTDLVIEFEDTGEGMSKQTQTSIFEPFFSTKETGLGLGLSIARNIIHAHGGSIRVDSTLGCGTYFYLTLPVRTSRNRTSD